MKGTDYVGGSLCFLGLVLGAMTGAIAALLVPVAAGLVIAGAASWRRAARAASWRAQYPKYRY